MRDLILGSLTITLSLILLTYYTSLSSAYIGIDLVIPKHPIDNASIERYYVYRQGNKYVLAYSHTQPRPGYVAIIEVWPGGYRCVNVTEEVKLGPNPYEGFWCPPPWQVNQSVPPQCRPIGEKSLGRVITILYSCH